MESEVSTIDLTECLNKIKNCENVISAILLLSAVLPQLKMRGAVDYPFDINRLKNIATHSCDSQTSTYLWHLWALIQASRDLASLIDALNIIFEVSKKKTKPFELKIQRIVSTVIAKEMSEEVNTNLATKKSEGYITTENTCGSGYTYFANTDGSNSGCGILKELEPNALGHHSPNSLVKNLSRDMNGNPIREFGHLHSLVTDVETGTHSNVLLSSVTPITDEGQCNHASHANHDGSLQTFETETIHPTCCSSPLARKLRNQKRDAQFRRSLIEQDQILTQGYCFNYNNGNQNTQCFDVEEFERLTCT
ncbi:hypothetical protein RFI_07352 [Reticulomyxa filosa]|uniref:Uncharacterized protein n=1 Tax=Reticulomyxa filosa TaxID=46433 RepID=X6NV45_RETFI|nr:hypothetical protein RFI_07352 [Reticulomyxa filosa]|eukprot:ETO29768.1 hypothetical protein RFI_07352 [Reticulomyxa filosa]